MKFSAYSKDLCADESFIVSFLYVVLSAQHVFHLLFVLENSWKQD